MNLNSFIEFGWWFDIVVMLCEHTLWVLCLRPLGDDPLTHHPFYSISLLLYCTYGVINCSHWSMIRFIFSLHHIQVEIQWIPCFTYAQAPFVGHVLGLLPLILESPCNGQFSIWFMICSRILLCNWSILCWNISVHKELCIQFPQKSLFYQCMGGIDESECYEKYARLGDCLKRFYM